MSGPPALRVVLCWHMHQPQYRDLVSGEPVLPWTYLHAIKDYVDMAVHLEAVPAAAAVVNFSPVLIEQIQDYSTQVNGYLRRGVALTDPVLRLLMPGGVPVEVDEREQALRACLKANGERLIQRFPAFNELAEMAQDLLKSARVVHASDQFIVDLAAWYHLAWLGETVRMGDPRVKELMKRAREFTPAECTQLLEVIGEILAGLLPRYRRLMGSGQVELSVTPYAHPIIPLMLDFNAAREALPDSELPEEKEYPGGDDRARWHIARALQVFTETFGVRPRGCWPSEGGVSCAALALLDDFGFEWAATGQAVLHNSVAGTAAEAESPHRAWHLPGQDLRCFFRHDELSDRIGFTYSTWHGDDAAANLVHELVGMADALAGQTDPVVSIVLDGENAWEYYPFNAYYFLSALYKQLSEHPRIKLSTFSQCLTEGVRAAPLPAFKAGSWVYGNFATWIGHAEKNRAWDMLCEAKHLYDQVVVEGSLSDGQQRAAERQLGICEGSDWFWWFGDYNPAESVASFDALYRRHLVNLYRLLGEQPPEYLSRPFTQSSGSAEHGGTMKRST